jgi:hypothetical protein
MVKVDKEVFFLSKDRFLNACSSFQKKHIFYGIGPRRFVEIKFLTRQTSSFALHKKYFSILIQQRVVFFDI